MSKEFVDVVDYLTRYGIIFPDGGPHLSADEFLYVSTRPGIKKNFSQFQKWLEEFGYGDITYEEEPNPYNTAWGYIRTGEMFIYCTVRYDEIDAVNTAERWYLNNIEPDDRLL